MNTATVNHATLARWQQTLRGLLNTTTYDSRTQRALEAIEHEIDTALAPKEVTR